MCFFVLDEGVVEPGFRVPLDEISEQLAVLALLHEEIQELVVEVFPVELLLGNFVLDLLDL